MRTIFASIVLLCGSELLPAQPIQVTLVLKDHLGNITQGLSPKDQKWFESDIAKKYNLRYVQPSPDVASTALVFFVTQTAGEAYDTDNNGRTTPAEYGIYTLAVERKIADGKFEVLHTFQQSGIYMRIYGIPKGKGHHPVHAVIEYAAKWISKGGLTDPMQTTESTLKAIQ